MGRLHRPYACALRTTRCLGRDTALCLAARGGHGATIAALVFAGADGGVSNNNGYGTRRGSAWVQSSHAFGLGRHTAEKLAEEAGTSAEYEEAVRKVRRVQRSTGRAVGLCRLGAAPGLWPREAVGLPGLTRAFAYRVGIPILSLSPVGEGGLRLRVHSSELAARGRRVRPCVRRTSVAAATLALPERAAPHRRRLARPLSGAASRATGARRGWSAAQAAHWKAFGRREKTAVRPGDAEPHACAPRGCTDSSSGSVGRPVHAS